MKLESPKLESSFTLPSQEDIDKAHEEFKMELEQLDTVVESIAEMKEQDKNSDEKWKELFTKTQPKLRKYLKMLLIIKGTDTAGRFDSYIDDAIQYAFYKAFVKDVPLTEDEDFNVIAWLHVTARNKLLDMVSRLYRISKVELSEEDAHVSLKKVASSEQEPLENIHAEELDVAIRTTIDNLSSENLKSVARLKFYENLSAEEIEKKLGISRDNYYQRVRRVRKHLLETMTKMGYEKGEINYE